VNDVIAEIEESNPEEKIRKSRLTKLCYTRWTEKSKAVITLKELFVVTYDAFGRLQETGNSESSKRDLCLQQAMESGSFIVCLVILHEVFSTAHALTAYLQGVNVDLEAAMTMADHVREQIQEMRHSDDAKFGKLFEIAQNLAGQIGEVIQSSQESQKLSATGQTMIQRHPRNIIAKQFLFLFLNIL